MDDFLADPRVPIDYYPPFREYSLRLRHSRASQAIGFCPWCGRDLPTSLRGTYFELLEETHSELSIFDDPTGIPEEFRTDAWWRARGL